MDDVHERRPAARVAVLPASAGRLTRWRSVVVMRPVDPTEAEVIGRIPSRGWGWEVLGPDDRTLFARAAGFRTEEAAWRDAEVVVAARDQLRLLYVRDHRSSDLAWWLVREDRPTLVPARTWPMTGRTSVVRNAKRAVALLELLAAEPGWLQRPDLA